MAVLGGIPVVVGGPDGGQVEQPGQLQFGAMLLGVGTSAGWVDLVGWRDLPGAVASDSQKPQGHGSYPGDVFGDSLVVTYEFLLRGTPAAKLEAIAALERYARLGGPDQFLTVNDGDGPWFRKARVIGRHIPQEKHFTHAPLKCSIQFLCADPLRYALAGSVASAGLPESSGGLDYPLEYPLYYGTSSTSTATVTNEGSEATPLTMVFNAPLENPTLSAPNWSITFHITLVGSDSLAVDAAEGTVKLNGTADRLYTLRPSSNPLDDCVIEPGPTELSLTADAGSGNCTVSFHHARM